MVGDVTLIPYRLGDPVLGLDTDSLAQIAKILACYREMDGNPIAQSTLIRWKDESLLADLPDDTLQECKQFVDLACFSALAERDPFPSFDSYCNADCFQFYSQRFQNPDYCAIPSRTRSFGRWNLRRFEKARFSTPPHTDGIRRVRLDEGLLCALVNFLTNSPEEDWATWHDAILSYNLANTDSESIRYQVEWTLMCGAFQRFLGTGSNASRLSETFAEVLHPDLPIPLARANRTSARVKNDQEPLRTLWILEFCSVRGDFAHGKLVTRQPMTWKPVEHLLLASIAFPLLVKSVLAKKGFYSHSDLDRARINTFEALADSDFTAQANAETAQVETVWGRLLREAREKQVHAKALEMLRESESARVPATDHRNDG